MQSGSPRPLNRILSAAAAVAMQALLIWALLQSGHGTPEPPTQPVLQILPVSAEPAAPRERSVAVRCAASRPRERAAPANLRATPVPIVAPPPLVSVPAAPPLIAAPVPAAGRDPHAGAAALPGIGTGAGGVGEGLGGGGRGGSGDGDGGGETGPRWRSGRIKDSDYPQQAGEAGVGGTVAVRYRVGTDGRVGSCIVTTSSGDPALDALTCRLIQRRFRFDPARDEEGRPVTSTIVERHSWVIHPEAQEPR
jgi:periplasmic protein TonB